MPRSRQGTSGRVESGGDGVGASGAMDKESGAEAAKKALKLATSQKTALDKLNGLIAGNLGKWVKKLE